MYFSRVDNNGLNYGAVIIFSASVAEKAMFCHEQRQGFRLVCSTISYCLFSSLLPAGKMGQLKLKALVDSINLCPMNELANCGG